jgi:hypothetical protein
MIVIFNWAPEFGSIVEARIVQHHTLGNYQ